MEIRVYVLTAELEIPQEKLEVRFSAKIVHMRLTNDHKINCHLEMTVFLYLLSSTLLSFHVNSLQCARNK
ncbi:hypothetical protein VCR31J2_1290170 [Vibrio coralliirubri]|uniref:Uncharacterized protein n=1 Tax=Vibrio coralliirubri TaxID=1516159 RepID=A0AA87C1P3_9VIBR|nr:hypothetical protein VCR31J2_1290170 [Vibrio coralliirubri]